MVSGLSELFVSAPDTGEGRRALVAGGVYLVSVVKSRVRDEESAETVSVDGGHCI